MYTVSSDDGQIESNQDWRADERRIWSGHGKDSNLGWQPRRIDPNMGACDAKSTEKACSHSSTISRYMFDLLNKSETKRKRKPWKTLPTVANTSIYRTGQRPVSRCKDKTKKAHRFLGNRYRPRLKINERVLSFPYSKVCWLQSRPFKLVTTTYVKWLYHSLQV